MSSRKTATVASAAVRTGRIAAVSAGLLVVFAIASFGQGQTAAPEDPFPIKRVIVPEKRVGEVLEQARQGIFVQMPREEFEAKVRKAAAQQSSKDQPRLAKATYSATLKNDALVNGNGHWTVLNSGKVAGILPVADFNLAVSKIKNMDDDHAVLGELDGKKLGLEVRADGDEFFLDWSLRGTSTAAGLQFRLQVPPSPIATLELTLPSEYQVTVPSRGVMLTSPPESKSNGATRRWLLHFSGQSVVEFTLRSQPGSVGAAPLIVDHVQSRQLVLPGSLEADFDFHFEVLHHGVRQLTFECDPDLKPYEVVQPKAPDASYRMLDIQGWGFSDGKVTVTLRQPFQGGPAVVRIQCLAPIDFKRPWTSPGMRLPGTLHRGESLKLTVHPDVFLDKWDAGSFRLTGVENEGTTMVLVERGVSPLRRPEVMFKTQAQPKALQPEAVARQNSWWQVGPNGSVLTSDISLHMPRGKLFQLALKLPKSGGAWRVDTVETSSKETLRHTTVAGDLLLDLTRPLTQTPLKVRVRLLNSHPVPTPEAVLAFPDLEPKRTRRAGTLAISVDPLLQGTLTPDAPPPTAAESEGPWKGETPDYFLPIRGQAVPGKLKVAPRPELVRGRARSDVSLTDNGLNLRIHLDIEKVSGNPQVLDLFFAGSAPGPWQWQSSKNLVRKIERVPPLETLSWLPIALPFSSPPWEALFPSGEMWRVTLARPLDRRDILIGETTLARRGPPPQNWQVPLITHVNGQKLEGEVTLRPGTAKAIAIKLDGVQEEKPPSALAQRIQVFRYTATKSEPRLQFVEEPGKGASGLQELVGRGHLITYVEPGHALWHQFRFQVWNWQQPELPIVLPAGSRVIAAKTDGRWQSHLRQRETPAGVEVFLAAPAGNAPHSCEIFYQDEATLGAELPWLEAEALAPKLPGDPPLFRRTWRLAPGLSPLDQQNFLSLDFPSGRPLRSELERKWHAGDPWLTSLGVSFTDDWLSTQRQALASAEASLPRAPAEFGATLQHMATDYLKMPILLDTTALQALGVHPHTQCKFPGDHTHFWDSLGLIYVPSRAGPVLTSRLQGTESMKASGAGAFAARHEAALAEAARYGRDATVRFMTAAEWLRGTSELSDTAFLPARVSTDWTTWEPSPGTDLLEPITLVNESGVRLAGVVAALLVAVVAWVIGRAVPAVWRVRLLACALGAAVIALLWIAPALRELVWWMLAPLALLFAAAYFQLLRQQRPSAPPPKFASSAAKLGAPAAGLILLAMISAPQPLVHAQIGDASTVFILPGPSKMPERERVLVPMDMVKRLDSAAIGPGEQARQAVLVSAHYKGKLTEEGADFTATFSVHAFADNVALVLPLGGVDLQENVLLNRVRVLPVALPGQAGYRLSIPAKGTYRLELSFRVRLPSGAEELQFVIPKLAQSYLEADCPDTYQAMQCRSQGEFQADVSGKNQLLRADLGREGKVHLQWRRQNRPAPAVNPQVAEVYFWDLRPPFPSLTAVLTYSAAKGNFSHVAIQVPEGLEIRTPEVSADGGAQLKNWELKEKPGSRVLHIDLAKPVSGKLRVKLVLLPRQPVAAGTLPLRFLSPLQVAKGPAFLAYRLEEYEATETSQGFGVTPISPKAFAKVWSAAGQGKMVPTRAYIGGTTPKAILELTLTLPKSQVTPQVTWRVHPHHADFTATVHWQAPREDLVLLEADIPVAVNLLSVTSPEAVVHSWGRVDSKVQIWLDKPSKEVTLEFQGYVKHAAKLFAAKVPRFTLPALRFIAAKENPSRVAVEPGFGVVIEPERVGFLTPVKGPHPAGTWVYTMTDAGKKYDGSFRLSAAATLPTAHILSRAEMRDSACHFSAQVDLAVTHGDLRSVRVELKNWHGGPLKIEAPGTVKRTELKPKGDMHAWLLQLPPGTSQSLRVSLSGYAPVPIGKTLAMPEVRVPGAQIRDHVLVISGPELQAEKPQGLTRLQNPAVDLRAWPEEADRVGPADSAWRAGNNPWQLAMALKPVKVDAPVTLLLTEHEAALRGNRWNHQAQYWLHARAVHELIVAIPPGAKVRSVALNDALVAPQAGPLHVSLTLPQAGAHLLRVAWSFEIPEPLEQPNLASPTLQGLPSESYGVLHVPRGLFCATVPVSHIDRARQWITRAEAQLSLMKLEPPPGRSKSAADWETGQRRFYGFCGEAKYHLALAGGDDADAQVLRVRLAGVQKQNLAWAREASLEEVRKNAEKRPLVASPLDDAAHSLAGSGIPIFVTDARTVALPLLDESERTRHEIVLAANIVLALVLALIVLSGLARALTVCRWLWPEHFLAIGLIGCIVLGLSLFGVLLIVLGVLSRILLTLIWLHRIWQAPVSQTVSTMHASS